MTALLNDTDLAEAIATGACRDCGGAGEIVERLGQNRVTGLIHDRSWRCHECNGTGQAPVYDDGLTDQQYASLVRAETAPLKLAPVLPEGMHPCAGVRGCTSVVASPGVACAGCLREIS